MWHKTDSDFVNDCDIKNAAASAVGNAIQQKVFIIYWLLQTQSQNPDPSILPLRLVIMFPPYASQ